MATRAPQTSQNRQGNYGSGGPGDGGVDVGHRAIARMAREDTQWFIVAVVILSLVLFLALPAAMLIYVDSERRMTRAEIRIEQKLKKLEQLEKRLKEKENE